MNEPKVFSIGLPRTGNQSLFRALGILCYARVGHDPEVFDSLRMYNAAVELRYPVAHLETAFPGSLYIFTARDKEPWLASVKRIQPFAFSSWNPFWFLPERDWWPTYVRRLTELRAGIPPERVLIFDVKDGWGPLCTFLSKAIPDKPFPNHDGLAKCGR